MTSGSSSAASSAARSVPGAEATGAALRLVSPGDPGRLAPKPLGVSQPSGAGGGRELIGLGVVEVRHHVHVLGPTGTGKSTLLLRLVLADAVAGRGVILIDPHGDLALRVLERLPAGCRDRLVLIDPEQTESPVAWNVLDPSRVGPELVTEHLVATLHRLYSPWWGPRLEDTLRAACLTLTHPSNQPTHQPTHQHQRQLRGLGSEAGTRAARGRERASEWAGEAATERASEPGSGVAPAASGAGGRAPGGVAPTLADIPVLLTHAGYRARVTAAVRRADPGGLGAFWDAYDALTPAQLAAVGGPVLSKLRAITSRRFALDLLGSAPSTLDLGQVLDGGILIARLPKGVLGEDTTRLVGSLLLSGLWQAATARTRQGEGDRLDASVVVDECHNFLHLPIGLDDALAEARSYRLSWILAHQHLGQLPKPMADAIDANARNKIYFGLSPQDAHVLARHTAPHLTDDDLTRLDGFQIACRLMVGHEPARPFTLQTLPPPSPIPGGVALARQAASARGLSRTARRDHAARRRRLAITPSLSSASPLDPELSADLSGAGTGGLSDPASSAWVAGSPAHSLARSPARQERASDRATRHRADPQVTPEFRTDDAVPDSMETP
ncbi:MAG TPA: DUF87 domain-containing protein [Kineosporiaceae bacterium]